MQQGRIGRTRFAQPENAMGVLDVERGTAKPDQPGTDAQRLQPAQETVL